MCPTDPRMLIDTGLIVVGSLAALLWSSNPPKAQLRHQMKALSVDVPTSLQCCFNESASHFGSWTHVGLCDDSICLYQINSNHIFKGIGMFPESCTQLMFYAHLCSGFGCIIGAATALRIFLPQSATHDSNPMRVRAMTWDLGLWSWLTKSRARQMSAQKNLRFKRFGRSFQEKLY